MVTKRIIFALIIPVLAHTVAAAIPTGLRNSMSQCGINSLYLCMRYHGLDVNLNDVYSSIPPDENYNVTLYELAKYAESKGLSVKPIPKPNLKKLNRSLTKDRTAILQYEITFPNGRDQGHIVALLRPDSRDIWVLDFPRSIKKVSHEQMADTSIKSKAMVLLSLPSSDDDALLFHIGRSPYLWPVAVLICVFVCIAILRSSTRGRKNPA